MITQGNNNNFSPSIYLSIASLHSSMFIFSDSGILNVGMTLLRGNACIYSHLSWVNIGHRSWPWLGKPGWYVSRFTSAYISWVLKPDSSNPWCGWVKMKWKWLESSHSMTSDQVMACSRKYLVSISSRVNSTPIAAKVFRAQLNPALKASSCSPQELPR